MTPLAVPRTRKNESNTLTIPGLHTSMSGGIQSTVHPNEETALAYRPPWYADPWFPTPALTSAVVGGRKMDDYLVPGVNKLIREGVIVPTNPLTSVDRHYPMGLATFGTVARRVFKSGSRWRAEWIAHQCWARPAYSSPVLPEHDLNRLVSARAYMQSGYTDLLTFAAEFHKTVELIVKFRERVLLALDDLVLAWSKRQKRPFRTYSQAFESLSSFWLEWRFGWRILMYDYEGIVAAINDLDGSQLRRPFRDRKTMESETTSRAVVNSAPGSIALCGRMVARRDTVTTTQFSGGCLGDGRLHAATIDPLVTAWELLPLSLVLDMFWNLGDWISANSWFAQVEEVDAWTSVYRTISETVSWEYIPPAPQPGLEVMKQLQPIGATSLRIDKSRKLQVGIPTPINVDINLSPSKIFDLVAIGYILRGLVTKRVRLLTNRG